MIEIPIFPKDLMAMLGIQHPNTLRLKIKSGQVPEPDVRLSAKTRYWHRSTLVRAKLMEADQTAPDAASSQSAQA